MCQTLTGVEPSCIPADHAKQGNLICECGGVGVKGEFRTCENWSKCVYIVYETDLRSLNRTQPSRQATLVVCESTMVY